MSVSTAPCCMKQLTSTSRCIDSHMQLRRGHLLCQSRAIWVDKLRECKATAGQTAAEGIGSLYCKRNWAFKFHFADFLTDTQEYNFVLTLCWAACIRALAMWEPGRLRFFTRAAERSLLPQMLLERSGMSKVWMCLPCASTWHLAGSWQSFLEVNLAECLVSAHISRSACLK